ncbi:taurine ABC transporter substrate-binding protein [Rhodobacter sp. TJ_12]|uniref:taurine ABC transporter substrate-binding protein n=1 Tax=Rhodobacter sp. TJ_12 TaxID=2029399 RepID=UPI001CBEE5AC|nr:taurine ABC transporter substrate-binding protein [Rhodobacter sp. TJ_12]MBZ4021738.1 taurine ABC transporter substrate-binding protein [Rhodobacter sp. TJ_12]
MIKTTALRLSVSLIGLLSATGLAHAEKLIIGHFGIPLPMMTEVGTGAYDEAMGYEIEWRKFGSGTEVIAAMASGDVKLAALGSSPFAIGASQGVPAQLFMLSGVIGTAESLIARDGAGIESLEDLKGKRVAVPVGSTAHFSLVGALAHAGIAEGDLTILNMPPDQIVAAWSQDAIDAAFIWDPAQSSLLENGTRIVGADETAKWGYPTFDGWVVNKDFAAEHPEAVAGFVKVTTAADAAYLADPAAWTAESAPVMTIAEATGADPAQVPAILAGYTFMPAADQAGPDWLGGGLASSVKATAEFLKAAGRIDTVAEDYSAFITLAPVEAAISE